MALPRATDTSPSRLSIPDWTWNLGHEPFNRLGHCFLLVSPIKTLMYTTNAEVIRHVTSRRDQFPKPLDSYAVLNLFGRNVVTTEGAAWRFHRKITAAGFNEKNTALIFAEAVKQTQTLIQRWLGPDGGGNTTIRTASRDTMTLALNIIGYVGFGLKLIWPGQEWPAAEDARLKKYGVLEPPQGHTLSFAESLSTVLDKIVFLLIFPPWMLSTFMLAARYAWMRRRLTIIPGLLPFKTAQKVLSARNNYKQFMEELIVDKAESMDRPFGSQGGMDIMGQLVRSKYAVDDKKESSNGSQASASDGPIRTLTDTEIIGNAFIMILAGHETSANSIHFTLLELACNPSVQRQVQADVDSILGRTSDPATWDYESKINALMGSWLAACMHETLRIIPPVCEVPKMVTPDRDQVVMIDGRRHRLPAGMLISLTIAGAHRNPRSWPARPSKVTPGKDSDLDDWVPERWFRSSSNGSAANGSANDVLMPPTDASLNGELQDAADDAVLGGYKGPETSAALFRPPRGAYIPFSDGPRSCLGRRIAQVEIIAALATFLQRYSVELAVDEWATDAELEAMSRDEKATLYARAQQKARETIGTARTVITLQLRGGKHVPIRLVRRGEERFVNWVEA